jgi:ribosomal protein L11 methyltransferase
MLVWQRRASAHWLAANEEPLCDLAGDRLAIIQAPNRKMALLEIAGTNRRGLDKIRARFGGRIERLSPDWLGRAREQRGKPIKIGNRLTICRSRPRSGAELIIRASTAFGTGEHATTAMSLRFLEQITRNLAGDWSLLDLGTGSGILALAARKFGASKIVAIDSDARAIRVAKENARLNGVRGIDLRLGDARNISRAARFTIVTANLFSELLIEILPKLKRCRWLIFSGILREQESQIACALEQSSLRIFAVRRRGKWVALLCCHPERSEAKSPAAP